METTVPGSDEPTDEGTVPPDEFLGKHRPMFYTLEGHTPVAVPHEGMFGGGMVRWSFWYERAVEKGEVIVARDYFDDAGEEVLVSTVFLGRDSGIEGDPELFETMVFGGKYDQYRRRWPTWDEAAEGHQDICDTITSEGAIRRSPGVTPPANKGSLLKGSGREERT